ncbi:hypothetical protein [Halosolutus halophilus]|uniref:hypothetical protein n=1 Tax=Halosolutus halophilus TaxID=1552990 RepID=UPI00223520ED|nr:hypothetical protein [Halosolutus halophilus]
MTTWLLIADDGYGCHLESGLQYTTLCGRTFDAAEVERVEYEGVDSHDHPHSAKCFDCLTVNAGGEVSPCRRGIHFSGGGSA